MLSRTVHTNLGQYMPTVFAQGNPQYRVQIPRLHDGNCDPGIEQFLVDPLLGGVKRRSSIELYGTTADEMCGRQDPMNEPYQLYKNLNTFHKTEKIVTDLSELLEMRSGQVQLRAPFAYCCEYCPLIRTRANTRCCLFQPKLWFYRCLIS